MEALYLYVTEGVMPCSLGVSCFFVLGGVLLTALLVRRAFCGWVCPLGTIFDWLQAGARRLGLRPLRVSGAPGRWLGLLKYGVLGLILWFTYTTGELVFRGYDPCYALISRHGEDITLWAYVISGGLVVASVVIVLPFCRWLCPLAAVLSPLSRLGLTRVQRSSEACLDCGACTRACPTGIPVAEQGSVRAARCLGCLECLEACPARAEGALSLGVSGRRVTTAVVPVALLLCLGTAVGLALAFPLPSFVRSRGELPVESAVLEHQVQGLTCRGSATRFVTLLFRDDLDQVAGPLRLQAWPAPGSGRVRITYDPSQTTPAAIRGAVLTPLYLPGDDRVMDSPFLIEGYDPLEDLELELAPPPREPDPR
jgi:ferredoxin